MFKRVHQHMCLLCAFLCVPHTHNRPVVAGSQAHELQLKQVFPSLRNTQQQLLSLHTHIMVDIFT